MFVVSVQAHYDSAHFLRNYKGKCEKLHGHRYVVELAMAKDEVDEIIRWLTGYDQVGLEGQLEAGNDFETGQDRPFEVG